METPGGGGGLMDEFHLMKDQKYRVYMSNVDKALKNFEYSSEWADLISALGKLNKVISNYPKYQIIPRRIKISKRLAQCMHPALPSGVHLKALESYDVIFQNTGSEMLAIELFIYSAGLFPLLRYAAMNVRPALLGIYEKYFVPLGDRLRPALSGFLSGVLPGYEAGLDHFDQTNSLLEQVARAVGEVCFYTCLWECVATNASIRLPAVSYILDHFNKRQPLEHQSFFLGRNHDIMMSGLCACLNDMVILVQRNALEFLLIAFPMHNAFSLKEADLIRLVTNSLNTILRRDMSLNRRLYSWLLGTEVSAANRTAPLDAGGGDDDETGVEAKESYFERFSKRILIRSLKLMLKMSLNFEPIDLRPYKILVSLLDKLEIGPPVLDFVLFDVVRTMALSMHFQGGLMPLPMANWSSDVNKSAQLLFATFDPAYIWNFMTSQYERSAKRAQYWVHQSAAAKSKGGAGSSCKVVVEVDSGLPSLPEVCYLTEFLLETISLEMYNETTRIFLPKVFLAIVQMLTQYSEFLSHEDVIASLRLCLKIVARVQPMIASPSKRHSKVPSMQHMVKSNVSSEKEAIASNCLEKSKSDSRLNNRVSSETNSSTTLLPVGDEDMAEDAMKRSKSNQNIIVSGKKSSPKKHTKKSKSYSKLTEGEPLDLNCSPTGHLLVNSAGKASSSEAKLLMKRLKKSPMARLKNSRKAKEEILVVEVQDDSGSAERCSAELQEISVSTTTDDNEGGYDDDGEDTSLESEILPVTSLQEYSILEQCIKQYEMFFQVFFSRQIFALLEGKRVLAEEGQSEGQSLLDEYSSASLYNLKDYVVVDSPQDNLLRLVQIDEVFETLLVSQSRPQRDLDRLLEESILVEQEDQIRIVNSKDQPERDQQVISKLVKRMMNLKLYDSLRTSIKLASSLLVELSTFPNYNQQPFVEPPPAQGGHFMETIPHWLKMLAIGSCYLRNDKEIQINCISMFFELVSLLQAQYEPHALANPGVTYVVMLPLMRLEHIRALERGTRVFQLLSSILWDYLADDSIDRFQVTSLLYQLHASLDHIGIVESVISHRLGNSHLTWRFECEALNGDAYDSEVEDGGQSMDSDDTAGRLYRYSNERMASLKILCPSPVPNMLTCQHYLNESQTLSFRKFELLWHLGRDRMTKGFDKILFQMLDYLALPNYAAMRSFVSKWLQESLVRGDLPRLLNALLLFLLAATTKRIGVVHAHVQRKGGDGAEQPRGATSGAAIDIWYNPDAARSGRNSMPDLYADDLNLIAVSTENGNNVAYQKVSRAVSKGPEPAAVFQAGGTGGGGLHSSNGNSHKAKRSPIRTIQKRIFGVSACGGGTGGSATTNNRPMPPRNMASGSGLSQSTTNSISVIINPMEVSTATLTAGHEPGLLDAEGATETTITNTHVHEDQSDLAFGEQLLSSSAPTGAVGFLVSDQSDEDEDVVNDDGDSPEKEVGEVALELPTLENDSEEDELSWQHQPGHGSMGQDTNPDERSSCDSIRLTGDGQSVGNRFVGDVNHIGDVMSEHDRTKNKKNYNLESTGGKKKGAVPGKERSDEIGEKKWVKKKRLSGTSKGSTGSSESKERYSDTGPITSSGAVDDMFSKNNINWEQSKRNVEILRENCRRKPKFFDKIHPLHSHMLLYHGVYDTSRVLYCLRTLRSILANEPRTFLVLTMTTSVSDANIKGLLIRHRKSVCGRGFDGVIANTEFSHVYRGCMYLESLITTCLYYMRSYFPKSMGAGGLQGVYQRPTEQDIEENARVQLASMDLLTAVCNEMVMIAKEMGKGFVPYIADLISKCKLQKIVLHSVLTSVYSFNGRDDVTLTDEVLRFNDPGDDHLHYESQQIALLKLLKTVIRLEFEVTSNNSGSEYSTNSHNQATSTASGDQAGTQSPTRAAPNTPTNIKYLNNFNICQQPMFLSAILNALQADHFRHLHKNWTDIIVASLGCFVGGSLTNIVISVVHQICNNLDKITMLRATKEAKLPPDYTLTQVEALTVLVHYCLLDSTQQLTLSHVFSQAFPQSQGPGGMGGHTGSMSTNQLLNNLVHVFLSTPLYSGNSAEQDKSKASLAMHMAARNAMLSHLPRIVASVAALWDNEIGQGRLVNKQLLELLSPISLHNSSNFLAAIAVVWQERGDLYRRQQQHQLVVAGAPTYDGISTVEEGRSAGGGAAGGVGGYQLLRPLPQACAEQLSLVKLISGIRIMPMDTFVLTLHQVVKQPPAIHQPPPGLSLDVSALELFYFYMRSVPESQLNDAWSSLLTMLKDGLALSAPGQFVMLAILSDFVQRSPQMPFSDKRDLRDLHDITSKLIESISAIGASCLEQTTWLRRNLAVKEDSQQQSQSDGIGTGLQVGTGRVFKDHVLMGNQQYAVQAQSVLAGLLANLLDITYGSQEKDKVVAIVTTLMYNITPYLKNHTVRNIPSFLACSSLLASLSTYQYTRKAWRKDVLDLLLEPSFFQMDISCLPHWKCILDSLMTCDNTTFRELMNRVSMSQTGSLNIFASKEMEYEQRAALLKRLAFIIFCSEFDQYHKYMPEIQEQLANSLRLPQIVPSVQASVLLCFRVLLLRMSPDHVTSLWPIIIAEMVQVLLSMEQELKVDSEEFREHIKVLSGLNSQWVTNSNNGLHANGHPQWRMVQLETAKLLELGCVLPATNLPHFQMYRWAFVGGVNDDYLAETMVNSFQNAGGLSLATFIPHVTRIARLMDLRFTSHSSRPESQRRGQHLSLMCQSIQSLQDLYGFFSTLSIAWPPYQFSDMDKEVKNCLSEIESVLSLDFLEKMPQSVTSPSTLSQSVGANGLTGHVPPSGSSSTIASTASTNNSMAAVW